MELYCDRLAIILQSIISKSITGYKLSGQWDLTYLDMGGTPDFTLKSCGGTLVAVHKGEIYDSSPENSCEKPQTQSANSLAFKAARVLKAEVPNTSS